MWNAPLQQRLEEQHRFDEIMQEYSEIVAGEKEVLCEVVGDGVEPGAPSMPERIEGRALELRGRCRSLAAHFRMLHAFLGPDVKHLIGKWMCV